MKLLENRWAAPLGEFTVLHRLPADGEEVGSCPLFETALRISWGTFCRLEFRKCNLALTVGAS